MTDTHLQDFVTQTATRGQITFGDVRRLQRDCLPRGINAGEEAEILIWLDGNVTRTDKAWSQWLVTAVADFALRSELTDELIADWLKRLMATTGRWPTVGRRIVREINRARRLSRADVASRAEETGTFAEAAPIVPAADAEAHAQPTKVPHRRKRRIKFRSQKKSTPARSHRSTQRSRREAWPSTITAPQVWSSGMTWKHMSFQLAAPCA